MTGSSRKSIRDIFQHTIQKPMLNNKILCTLHNDLG